MQNGNWSRLVIEALIVFCVGMGSILLWDSGATFYKTGLSWKEWRAIINETAANQTTPVNSCGATPITFRNDIIGACRILNGQQSCCGSTPPITPEITIGDCPSRCVNLYSAYWCTVSCQGNFHVDNGTASLCSSSVQQLLTECSACSIPLLPYQNPAQFQEAVFIKVAQSDAPGCFAFANFAYPAETAPPQLISTSVQTSPPGNINNPTFPFFTATLTAIIRNAQVLYGGRVACVGPNGKQSAIKTLSSNDFELLNNGDWRLIKTCEFGLPTPPGAWNFFLRVENTNSSVVSDSDPSTKFNVVTNYQPPAGNFGDLFLCSPRTPAENSQATGVPTLNLNAGQQAEDVNCCAEDTVCTIAGAGVIALLIGGDTSPLELAGFVGTIVSIQIPQGTEGLLLTANAAISITGNFICGSGVFGTDGSNMNFIGGPQASPGGNLQASAGCVFDVSTISVDFLGGGSSGGGVTVTGTPGANINNPSLSIQQTTAGAGSFEVNAPFRLGPNAVLLINGLPGAAVAEFLAGISYANPAAAGNEAVRVFLVGGIVFGSSAPGYFIQDLQLPGASPPVIKRATSQPDVGTAVILCGAPGSAVQAPAQVVATERTKVFIRPQELTGPDCSVNRVFKLKGTGIPATGVVDPSPGLINNAWVVSHYFGVPEAEFLPPNTGADYPTTIAAQQRIVLEVHNNARLVMVNVRPGGPFAVVRGAVNFRAGSTIEVELAQQNIATSAFEILLMRYISSTRCNVANPGATCSNDACDVDATLIVSNPFPARPATLICRNYRLAEPNANLNSGWKELVLQFPAAPVDTPPGAATLPFISTNPSTILMDRTITDFPQEKFLLTINNILGITPAEIAMESYIAVEATRRATSRTQARFRCRSSIDINDANAKCDRIVREANTPGSALANELRTISVSQGNDRAPAKNNSDSALYGLFALAAIPIICIVLLCLCFKNRNRQAENQFMQDSATFSNVAAQPQPINNPYPYYDPNLPAQALIYDGKAPAALPPPAYPQYGY